jgi:hypothetical protein
LTIHAVPTEERDAYDQKVALFYKGEHILYGEQDVELEDGARCEVRLLDSSRLTIVAGDGYQDLFISRVIGSFGSVGDARGG